MITERDLQEAIIECENQQNPNANTCMKLASYYIIKDKMYPPYYSTSAGTDTEFLALVTRSKDIEKVWQILDELMTTVEVINPKLYNAVISKIKSL